MKKMVKREPGDKTPATGKEKLKAGDRHDVVGKKPPRMGSKMNAKPAAKKEWRDRNTSKVGMGGHAPKSAHKRLKGLII